MANKISNQTREKILQKSAQALPDNPSACGWSAQDVKNALTKPTVDASSSLLTEINRIVDEFNAELAQKFSLPTGGIRLIDLSADLQTLLQSGGGSSSGESANPSASGGVSSVNGKTGTVILDPSDIGAVASVNGKTGAVTLSASDVSALPADTAIPAKTSDLQNDSGFLTAHQSLAAYRTASDQDVIDGGKLSSSLKGAASGVAELDEGGKVPASQLPSYVDDVLEYATLASFPAAGESGKIYVDIAANKTYRWSGTAYVEISSSLALGETSATAYRGDRGKTAYDHAQATGNPHGVTYQNIGGTKPTYTASEVGALPANTTVPTALSQLSADTAHRTVTDAEKTAWNGKQSAVSDLETIRANAAAVAGKEDIGKITVGSTAYTVRTSTADSGAAGYITLVLEA